MYFTQHYYIASYSNGLTPFANIFFVYLSRVQHTLKCQSGKLLAQPKRPSDTSEPVM